MPRKQNGFGNPKSLGFKGAGRVDRGKGVGAPGNYPSKRGYGSSVQRTVIEKYNLDSDWVKWRKGFEYYNQAAWYKLEQYDPISQTYQESQINSKLYQGTEYEVDVTFTGYKFATSGADSNNHYVMKRVTTSNPDIGVINQVNNDPIKYATEKSYKEIWCRGTPGTQARLLLQMIGERVTDGETEATLNYVLNGNKRPALYIGKTYQTPPTIVRVTVNADNVLAGEGAAEIENYQDLVGKICYVKDFYNEKPITDISSIEFEDSDYFFGVNIEDLETGQSIEVLDPGVEDLPPSLFDISKLPKLFSSSDALVEIKGSYVFKKDLYQRFFGKQYLTSDLVKNEVQDASYVVMPFKILGVEKEGSTLTLISVPFISELKLYTPVDNSTYLVFTDYSFTKTSIDEYDGRYYHTPGAPGSEPWLRINTDVDPWMDEVFTTGNPIQPATIYTCSCPNHSHSILRAPQETQDEGTRKINRQRRYPLPTVLGQADFEALGTNQAAGAIESWESREHRMSFKMCKHSIAAMFIEHKKVQEPNKYPTVDVREKFEAKLTEEIAQVGDRFSASYKRGGITAIEVVYALAQGLNLDDIETAYVVLNSNF